MHRRPGVGEELEDLTLENAAQEPYDVSPRNPLRRLDTDVYTLYVTDDNQLMQIRRERLDHRARMSGWSGEWVRRRRWRSEQRI